MQERSSVEGDLCRKRTVAILPEWVKETLGWDVGLPTVGVRGFVDLPERWIIGRAYFWNSRCRRNANAYERRLTKAKP
jgi:hypothetical protein